MWNLVPLIKFDGNTEPVMVNVQGSDINQMSHVRGFNTILAHLP